MAWWGGASRSPWAYDRTYRSPLSSMEPVLSIVAQLAKRGFVRCGIDFLVVLLGGAGGVRG